MTTLSSSTCRMPRLRIFFSAALLLSGTVAAAGRAASAATTPAARADATTPPTSTLSTAAPATTPANVEPLISPTHRLPPEAPAWRDLVERFQRQPDTLADFEEARFFPFRKEPTRLRGEVRFSRQHGLSLHYLSPEERTVIMDDQGMTLREPSGRTVPPPDPRANAANAAMRHILRFDFAAMERDFEVYGRRLGDAWSLALVPRAKSMRNAIGDMFVDGTGTAVQRIELRRSAKQHIDIVMSGLRPPQTFTADEVKRFFR